MKLKAETPSLLIALIAGVLLAIPPSSRGAAPEKKEDKQGELIRVLKSNAAPSEKALVCKQLAIYGTAKAVPALAPLLGDEDLASWARIALEAIPGNAPDAALRKAMGRLHGRMLVGTINSIAVRRDGKAVGGLIKHLDDMDDQVGSAAAVALGRIGGNKAAKALQQALADPPAAGRSAAAQGCLLCADWYSSHGQPAAALKLYEAVRTASVPKHLVLEATRLTILAKKSNGLPLLLEQLHSPDKAFFGVGLHTARELAGTEVSDALVSEMKQAGSERQALLLLAIADRDDANAASAVLEQAKSGSPKLRVLAIGALEKRGDVGNVPVLLEAALAPDQEVAQAAKAALTRLPGDEVDTALTDRLQGATGYTRQVLIEVAGKRRIAQCLPAVIKSMEDPDAGIRLASIRAAGLLGNEQQAADLVRLLQHTTDVKERAEMQTALVAISTRKGSVCVPPVLVLAQDDDSALRLLALPVLVAAGGSNSLAAVKAAVEDKDEAVRDEAVRTLSTWPNNWPEDSAVMEPLLSLAKAAPKNSYQVLALRGYLHFVEGDKQIKDSEKVVKIKAVMPLINRPEEQQLTLGIIGGISNAEALELLLSFADQPGTTQDACTALLKLATERDTHLSKEQRRQALQIVIDKTKDDDTRKKAERRLKQL